MRKIFLALLAFSCVSCGTISARGMAPAYGKFYPATKWDLKGIDDVHSESNWFFSPWLIVPFLIVDMPISLATDTLFLPVDTVIYLGGPEKSNSTDKR